MKVGEKNSPICGDDYCQNTQTSCALMANFCSVSSENTLRERKTHSLPVAVSACRTLSTPERPSVVHRCGDAPSVASDRASHYSGAEVGLPLPLTQSMWRAAGRAARSLRGWRIDGEDFGTFFGLSLDFSPDGSRCQVRSAITVRQRAPKSETPTGGALYVCEMQPFPRRLMKRRVGKYTAVIKGDTRFCFLQ